MSLKLMIKAAAGWAYLNSPVGRGLLQRGGVILMLHRVLEDDARAALPHRASLCVGAGAFEHLLLWLRRHFDYVPLGELLDAPSIANGRPRLALTFDDGWRDNFTHAFPLLKKHGVPASIFLSTDFIGSDRNFWWEALGETLWGSFGDAARQRLARRLRELRLPPPDALFQPGTEQARSQCLAHFLQALKKMPAKQLQVLADGCPVSAEPHALNWWQVRAMEASGLVSFGPHGASHAILTDLDERSLAAELKRSRETLEARCRAPLPIYCYPNGDHDERVRDALRRAGYLRALGTQAGVVRAPMLEALSLPRIGVSQQSAQRPNLLAWRLLQGARQLQREPERSAQEPQRPLGRLQP